LLKLVVVVSCVVSVLVVYSLLVCVIVVVDVHVVDDVGDCVVVVGVCCGITIGFASGYLSRISKFNVVAM
jgi:hypothetical protein